MSKDLKEALANDIARPALKPLGITQLICWLAIIASPFVWIWAGWLFAWKLALTGFILAFIIGLVARYIRSIVRKDIEAKIEKSPFLKYLTKINSKD
jgi:hypothetical protein